MHEEETVDLMGSDGLDKGFHDLRAVHVISVHSNCVNQGHLPSDVTMLRSLLL